MTMLRCHGFVPGDPSFENWLKVPPVVAIVDGLATRMQGVPGFKRRLRALDALRVLCEGLRDAVSRRMLKMTLPTRTGAIRASK